MMLTDSDLLRTQAYIGGHWVDGDGGSVIAVHNPATSERIGTVPDLGTGGPRCPRTCRTACSGSMMRREARICPDSLRTGSVGPGGVLRRGTADACCAVCPKASVPASYRLAKTMRGHPGGRQTASS